MSSCSDNRLQGAPLLPVSCHSCGAGVLVRKSSWQQTSIQWTAEATATCPQRQQTAALAPQLQGVFLACSDLRDSIDTAVERGALPIIDELNR